MICFFNDTATTEIYTLSLHDALPIFKAEGVTKSVQAFIDAAAGEPDAAGIQVGAYELQKQMKAADALEVLIDPDNLIGDRKSTRLNSSHANISYAVFCLKKKKQTSTP